MLRFRLSGESTRIARSIGRARIETSRGWPITRMGDVSPDQLVGRGLKQHMAFRADSGQQYRPINWSGAD